MILNTSSLPDIRKVLVLGKRVIVRLDLDVPLSKSKILDDTRLNASFQTIKYLLNQRAQVIIIGHLGRPKGRDLKYSLEPIVRWYQKKFKIQKIEGFDGWKL